MDRGLPKFNIFGDMDIKAFINGNGGDTTGGDQTRPKSPSNRFQQSTGPKISEVPEDPNANANTVADKSRGMYDTTRQEEDVGRHNVTQDAYTDSFAMSPDEWFKTYRYYNYNLAKNNPNGNLNARTFGNTQRLSRLTDAVNNQRHWRAAQIGRRTNSGFGTRDYTPGYSERWEPIATQEARQMRANEQIDMAARQRQAQTQGDVWAYPLESRKEADKLKRQLAYYSEQTGIDFNRLVQKEVLEHEYSQSWNTYWSNFITKFNTEYGLHANEKVLRKINAMDYPLNQVYAYLQAGAQIPDPLQSYAWQYIMEEARAASTQEEAMQIMFLKGGALANMAFASANMHFQGAVGFPNARKMIREQ